MYNKRKYILCQSVALLCFTGVISLLLTGPSYVQAQTQSPRIKCTETLSNGDVRLDWHLSEDSCGPYYIYASQNRNGPYSLIATITDPLQTSYVHTGANGTTNTWYYYIEADDCAGTPVIISDTVNNQDPEQPVLQRVTVRSPTEVLIEWYQSPSPETHAYIVYWFNPNNSSYIPIDTVYGAANTQYTHAVPHPIQNPIPDNRTEAYTVAAMDSCYNTGLFTTEHHRTIWLQTAVFRCGPSVTLDWTTYINWTSGVDEYLIMGSRNGGSYQQLGTVGPNTTTFEHDNVEDGDHWCYYVVAVHDASPDITSTSNVACLTIDVVQVPRYTYVHDVSVTDNNQITLTWLTDPDADILSYEIHRSTDDGNTFSLIERVLNVNLPVPRKMTFTDNDVGTKNNVYHYKVYMHDSCDVSHESLNTGRNVRLRAAFTDNYIHTLQWTPYAEWFGGVEEYHVYRQDMDGEWQRIGVTGAGQTMFVDNVTEVESEDGAYCYYVDALQAGDNVDTFYVDTARSRSNIDCVTQYPSIYVPNAFKPSGHNKVFRPVLRFADRSDYEMFIYDRWGKVLFRSDEPEQGWDGTYNGKPMPAGVYVYMIRFVNPDGSGYETEGYVTLVR